MYPSQEKTEKKSVVKEYHKERMSDEEDFYHDHDEDESERQVKVMGNMVVRKRGRPKKNF